MDALLRRQREVIASMFNAIASRYDLLNHLLSLGADLRWRNFAVQWLPASSNIIVDVGTGTGDFVFAAMRRCPDACFIGVDFSEEMVCIAKNKKPPTHTAQRQWLLADGIQLPLQDEVADAILCAFTVRNFADGQWGLREMWRVLKRGGVALILEFCQHPTMWWWTPIGLFIRYGIPLVGGLLSDPVAYAYLSASVGTFLPAEELAKRLTQVGFRQANWIPLTFGVVTFFRAIK